MDSFISLPPELIALIQSEIDSGRFNSSSEVVREALRLLERSDKPEADDIARLREAWWEGVESGDAGPLDFAELRETARNEVVAAEKE